MIAITTAGDDQISVVGTKLIAIAEAKTNYYAQHGQAGLLTVFTKAMLCNWMVSLAVVAAHHDSDLVSGQEGERRQPAEVDRRTSSYSGRRRSM